MISQIKYQLYSLLENTQLDEKETLRSYFKKLSDTDAAKLVAVFTKFPHSIAAYNDYVKAFQQENKPILPEKFEEILSSIITKYQK